MPDEPSLLVEDVEAVAPVAGFGLRRKDQLRRFPPQDPIRA